MSNSDSFEFGQNQNLGCTKFTSSSTSSSSLNCSLSLSRKSHEILVELMNFLDEEMEELNESGPRLATVRPFSVEFLAPCHSPTHTCRAHHALIEAVKRLKWGTQSTDALPGDRAPSLVQGGRCRGEFQVTARPVPLHRW